MKKTTKTILIILLLNLGFVNNAIGQVLTEEKNQSAQELYEFHISKKKANNTAAWITLGAGVAMIIAGYGINMSGGMLDETTNNDKGLWLSYLGGATTLVSIPLFISAGNHKRKAKIELRNGAVGFENEIKYSGIAISFSF